MDPNKSTVQERVFNSQGRIKREATFVYTGTGFSALNSVTYDDLGNLTKKTDASDRVLYDASYTGFPEKLGSGRIGHHSQLHAR